MNTYIERISICLLVFLATGAGMAFFLGKDVQPSSAGEPVLQAAFGVLYLLCLVFLARRFKEALSIVYQEKWTAVICLWALASTAWSVDPGETLRRALALMGTSAAGLYLGMRYEPKRQLSIIAVCLGIGALASIAAGLLFPGIAVLPDGAWQGVYHLKNPLGRMMALGVVCFTAFALELRRYRITALCMAVLCSVLLLLSQSATAIVVCMCMLFLLVFRSIFTWRARTLLAIGVCVCLIAVPAALWAMQHMDLLLLGLGRDPGLTGRLPLWHFVRQEIATRPLLGFGFSAFWTSSEAARLNAIISWDAPNAHNGVLETVLSIGEIGLALLAISFLRTLILGLRAARTNEDAFRTWPLLFLFFTVLYNLTESSFLAVNSMLWMIYVANSCWLTRATRPVEALPEDEIESIQAYTVSPDPGTVSP